MKKSLLQQQDGPTTRLVPADTDFRERARALARPMPWIA